MASLQMAPSGRVDTDQARSLGRQLYSMRPPDQLLETVVTSWGTPQGQPAIDALELATFLQVTWLTAELPQLTRATRAALLQPHERHRLIFAREWLSRALLRGLDPLTGVPAEYTGAQRAQHLNALLALRLDLDRICLRCTRIARQASLR